MALFIRNQMPVCIEDRKKAKRCHYSRGHRVRATQLLLLEPRFWVHFGVYRMARDRDAYDLLMRGA